MYKVTPLSISARPPYLLDGWFLHGPLRPDAVDLGLDVHVLLHYCVTHSQLSSLETTKRDTSNVTFPYLQLVGPVSGYLD